MTTTKNKKFSQRANRLASHINKMCDIVYLTLYTASAAHLHHHYRK